VPNVDDAFVAYQQLGLTPQLCAPEGRFLIAYGSCVSCSEEHSADPDIYGSVSEAFAYCNSVSPDYTLSVITITGIVESGTTTDKVYTVVVDAPVTSFNQSTTATTPTSLTTGAGGIETGDSGMLICLFLYMYPESCD
jgi:hypothetical protein